MVDITQSNIDPGQKFALNHWFRMFSCQTGLRKLFSKFNIKRKI